MKKVIVLFFVVSVMLASVFLFIGSCAGEENPCTKPTGPDYYNISFTLDGAEIDAEDIILNFGRPDLDADKPSVSVSPSQDSMYFEGDYCYHMETRSGITFKLYGWLNPSTPGDYIGEYGGGAASPVGGYAIYFVIMENGETYDYSGGVSGTITITTIGDVGGDVQGTFDITLESFNTPTPAPSYGSPLTAIGTFRLIRVSDNPLFFS